MNIVLFRKEEKMKKTHYKRAIEKLFEQWPWQYGFDPEKNITSLTIEPARSEDENDHDQYAQLTIYCSPDNYMYGKPQVITVSFNLSKP